MADNSGYFKGSIDIETFLKIREKAMPLREAGKKWRDVTLAIAEDFPGISTTNDRVAMAVCKPGKDSIDLYVDGKIAVSLLYIVSSQGLSSGMIDLVVDAAVRRDLSYPQVRKVCNIVRSRRTSVDDAVKRVLGEVKDEFKTFKAVADELASLTLKYQGKVLAAIQVVPTVSEGRAVAEHLLIFEKINELEQVIGSHYDFLKKIRRSYLKDWKKIMEKKGAKENGEAQGKQQAVAAEGLDETVRKDLPSSEPEEGA